MTSTDSGDGHYMIRRILEFPISDDIIDWQSVFSLPPLVRAK